MAILNVVMTEWGEVLFVQGSGNIENIQVHSVIRDDSYPRRCYIKLSLMDPLEVRETKRLAETQLHRSISSLKEQVRRQQELVEETER